MKGTCLCGSIEVVASDQAEVGLCHCSMCRRWTGGPMFAVHCGPNVEFIGRAPATFQSSDWAQCRFCPTCGTHLFYHLLLSNDYILPAGIFPDAAFKLTTEIFVDERPAYYEFSNDTKKMTGAEVFAQFASQD